MKTTLNEIQKHNPQKDLWETLLRHLNKASADDEPLPLLTVLESNGTLDALWCVQHLCDKYQKMRLTVLFAREVQELMSRFGAVSLDVCESYASGLVTEHELEAAHTLLARRDLSCTDRVAYAATQGEPGKVAPLVLEAIFIFRGPTARANTHKKMLEILKQFLKDNP